MMSKILLLNSIAALLIATPAFSNDTLVVKQGVREVKIGPRNVKSEELIDPVVQQQNEINAYLQLKERDITGLKSHSEALLVRSLLSGIESYDLSQPDLINQMEKRLEEAFSTGDRTAQALAFSSLGIYYALHEEQAKALQNFQEALKQKELLKDKSGTAHLSAILATLYKLQGNYENAIAQNEYSIQLNSQSARFAEVAMSYLSIAEIMILQNKFDEGEAIILKKSLPLFRRTGNKVGRMQCFQSLGRLYYLQNRLSESKWFYIQAGLMADKLNDREAQISNLIHLAEVKNLMGDYSMAISDFKAAEALAKQHKSLVKLVQIKGGLGEVYNHLGNYPEASLVLREYSTLRKAIPGFSGL